MAEPALQISRVAVGMVTLRCDLGEPGLTAALDRAVGCAPPGQRRFEVGTAGAAAWMAPDELMVFAPVEALGAALAALDDGLAGAHRLVVDVTDARAVFRLTGPGARETLAKGAPVDFAPDAFGPGDFRRSRLGQVAAAVWSPGRDVFELTCFRSVAEHVSLWLATAARSDGPGFLTAPGR